MANYQYRRHQNHHRNQHEPKRSILLDKFCARRIVNLQLVDIVSHVMEFATDSNGSKFIQRKLDDAPANSKDSIFREMQPHLLRLMQHSFANFVVQKFFDIGNTQQRLHLVEVIENHFFELCMHKYGCRVVQKAVEKMSPIHQISMINKHTMVEIIYITKHANGNHVIQKYFRQPNVDIQNWIFNQLSDQIEALCKNLYGCRVIQCILSNGSDYHRDRIFNVIATNPMEFVKDRCANYVIQHIFRCCAPQQVNALTAHVMNNFVALSQLKYASNVVEKCLVKASPEMIRSAMNEILVKPADWVKRLCTDAYANYVMQKLIDSATDEQALKLYHKLYPYQPDMKRQVCGRKIFDLLSKHLLNQAFQTTLRI